MKMQKNKDLIIFIILIPLFLYMAFFISTRISGKLPQYSTINKSKTGYSVIFESLNKLNYKCTRVLKPVTQQNTSGLQIVADGNLSFDIEDNELKAWIKRGGKLLYLTPLGIGTPEYAGKPLKQGAAKIYSYGKGCIITSDANYFMNKTLVRNTENAYGILKVLDEKAQGEIYFNEAHLYIKNFSKSLWDYVPVEFRFFIYQLLLIGAAFFYYRGKRFGKPIPLYEEVERDENEYLFAAAALYRQAKCWDVMLDSYYKNFVDNIEGPKEDWLDTWQRQELPQIKKAVRLNDFMRNRKGKIKKKEYIEIISIIQELTAILKKRRDLYWKTMKKLS